MNSAYRLTLNQDLTIYTALDTKPLMLDALLSNAALELDLSQVSEMDTAGLQLLLLLKREALSADKVLRIVAHSPAVRQTIDFCNLATYFGDPVVIAADEQV